MKKGTKLHSILTGKCPKCQEESMYYTKNAYYLPDILKMNEKCSNCNLKYRIEPSFFYGAMYVSYGVGIAFAVAAFVISHFVFNLSINNTFWVILATLIGFLPIIMRLSRNIWINIFIHFNPPKKH